MDYHPKLVGGRAGRVTQGTCFAFDHEGATRIGFAIEADELGDPPNILVLTSLSQAGKSGILVSGEVSGAVLEFPDPEIRLVTDPAFVVCGSVPLPAPNGMLLLWENEPVVAIFRSDDVTDYFSLKDGRNVQADNGSPLVGFSRWEVGRRDPAGDWRSICSVAVPMR